MSSKPPSSADQNPAEIAREAFRRLAVRRIAPTPDAYRDIYNEIAGIPAPFVIVACMLKATEAVDISLGGCPTDVVDQAARRFARGPFCSRLGFIRQPDGLLPFPPPHRVFGGLGGPPQLLWESEI